MDSSRERDQSVERLLRQSLKAPRQADATELCLDAETLAAWADGGLSGHALEMAQSHVADCERCQSLVGAMARANSVLPPSEPERTGRPWLAWLVPLTAVAAALTLWIAVPREKYVSVAPPPPVTEVQTEERKEPSPNSAPHAAAPAEAPKATNNAADQATLQAPVAAPPAAPAPELHKEAGRLETDALKEEERADKKAAAPASPAAAAPTAVGALAGASAQPARAVAAEAGADKARSANDVSQACSPGWSAAPADVAAQLTAGASPATSICWLVGRAGIVVLSIDDGRTWRRVTFPEITDLSTVRATDARAASVTTADGRQFSTSDGGATWTRR